MTDATRISPRFLQIPEVPDNRHPRYFLQVYALGLRAWRNAEPTLNASLSRTDLGLVCGFAWSSLTNLLVQAIFAHNQITSNASDDGEDQNVFDDLLALDANLRGVEGASNVEALHRDVFRRLMKAWVGPANPSKLLEACWP